ncbi:hypothetical protein [Klebsiella quasipneumoniae]|uniref:hypothetical protein n=1 Tax=Klebsiella quasipneumoniae TaxID=1463165 RepID=UPI002286C6BA|nr:hypothetical protein [Klebsiella quasipneumoniae]MCZ0714342.1 hypothetical protein [Klebsiella quasipneumoniae]
MKTKSRSILKIEKIINKIEMGDFNSSDIEILFVTARELPNASKKVFDIGSFVAHNNIRDKGYIREILLRNHLRLNFSFGYDKNLIKPELNEYPKYLPILIDLQIKIFDVNHFKVKLGLKGHQVNTAIKNLTSKKNYEIKSGICKIDYQISKNESNLMNEALSILNCADGIKLDDLINDLKTLLSDNGSDCDLNILDRHKKAIFCSLLCLINDVDYALIDGEVAKTVLSIDENKKVHAFGKYFVTMEINPVKKVDVMSPILSSDFQSTDIFDASVTTEDILKNRIKHDTQSNKIIKDI